MVMTVLVQTAGEAETSPINKDVLFIELNSIPDRARRGIVESERGEVELTLAKCRVSIQYLKSWSRHS
jgi:hypothetical protein